MPTAQFSEQPRWDFESSPSSVPRARKQVRETLTAWGLENILFETEIIVSELTTNAVLHAGTAIELGLIRSGFGVRIEVHDNDDAPVLTPAHVPTEQLNGVLDDERSLTELRTVIDTAPTGHGLRLVDDLADAWGVELRTGTGKTVWAEVGTGPGNPSDEPSFPEPAESNPARRIRIIAAPVRLLLEAELNAESYLREGYLRQAATSDSIEVTLELQQLGRLLDQASSWRIPLRERAGRAASKGERLVDLELPAIEGMADVLADITQCLASLRTFSETGQLSTVTVADEIKTFRHWLVEEVQRQLIGVRPTACPFPVVQDPLDNWGVETQIGPQGSRIRLRRKLETDLARASDVEGILRIALSVATDELSANTASVLRVQPDGKTIEIVASSGYSTQVERDWRTFSLSADLPASEAIRTGRTIVLRTTAERNERYPVFSTSSVLEDPAFVTVPFPMGTNIQGAIVLGFRTSRDFRSSELRFLAELAETISQSLSQSNS